MPRSTGKDIAEIFGYAPDDVTTTARSLWNVEGCPFTNRRCIKYNHDKTICYGTCSVLNNKKNGLDEEVIICPNRLYENNYETIKKVSEDAFGISIPFFTYADYIKNRGSLKECVVALGQNSGQEVKLGRAMSMDWVLVLTQGSTLVEYVGLEVQSMDITGNYRDTWHAYKNLPNNPNSVIPSSAHGINWANVHKRLIPQLIRKGLVYSSSNFVKKGLYFIVPDSVYQQFENQVGILPTVSTPTGHTMTVFTYSLGPITPHGYQRPLVQTRKLTFLMSDFAEQFIAGPKLPKGTVLDSYIKTRLGLT